MDWNQAFITLKASETKSGHSRAVPILDGDMRTWLEWALAESNGGSSVFHRDGQPIKSFGGPGLQLARPQASQN